jgi:hypothetical protein
MIGYLSLVKDNGKRAWIRSDEIAAFSENETKVDGAMVACTTVLLRNNVAWHFPGVTGEDLVTMMRGVGGQQVQVLKDHA